MPYGNAIVLCYRCIVVVLRDAIDEVMALGDAERSNDLKKALRYL